MIQARPTSSKVIEIPSLQQTAIAVFGPLFFIFWSSGQKSALSFFAFCLFLKWLTIFMCDFLGDLKEKSYFCSEEINIAFIP